MADNMMLVVVDSCDGTDLDTECGGATGSTCCQHTCLEGYSGGSIVCTQGVCPTGGAGQACWQITACEEIQCNQPSLDGYASVAETSLAAPSFDVSATCAAGYSGTAAAVVCSSQGSAYTLTGCVATTCVPPPSTVGYASILTTSLVKQSFDVSATCAAGYEGTAVAAVCSDHGAAYELAGCAAVVCVQPSSTEGYASVAETSLAAPSFDVSATCAAGYSGTAAAVVCSSQGSAYTLTGCAAIVCSRPAGSAGYLFAALEVGLDRSTGVAFNANVECADGYEGTAQSAVCTVSGPYTVSGCGPTICTRPAPVPEGYEIIDDRNLDLSRGLLYVNGRCADNYEGSFAASCSISGPYELTGCTRTVCITQEGCAEDDSTCSSLRPGYWRCVEAQPGYIVDNVGDVSPCPRGSFRSAAEGDCTLCERDTFQADLAAASCVACPLLSRTITTGSTSVGDCACLPGSRSVGGFADCTAVICGNNQHVEDHECVPCASGTMRPAGDDASGDDTSCDGIAMCDSLPECGTEQISPCLDISEHQLVVSGCAAGGEQNVSTCVLGCEPGFVARNHTQGVCLHTGRPSEEAKYQHQSVACGLVPCPQYSRPSNPGVAMAPCICDDGYSGTSTEDGQQRVEWSHTLGAYAAAECTACDEFGAGAIPDPLLTESHGTFNLSSHASTVRQYVAEMTLVVCANRMSMCTRLCMDWCVRGTVIATLFA